MSDLRSRSLIGLDLAKIRGLEIGPLDRPILPSAKGRIYYADHSSTEKIQAKYAADPIVNNERICEIDFDLSQVSLSSCAENGLFDVVAASHVIEHVPDLVGWLKDIQTILKPGGSLALTIPDKRYTFDIHRRVSALWMVEASVGHKRPEEDIVLDYLVNVVSADAGSLWNGQQQPDNLRRIHSVSHCRAMIDRHKGGEYVDVHCWVFTPDSFIALINSVIAHYDLKYQVSFFETTHPGQLEFYARLQKL